VAGFSPDGEYVAYSHPSDETSQIRDLFLMTVDGSREVRLTETPADEDILGWAPDGSLLFKSNRSGRYAVWMIGVENGMPIGSAVMLWTELGNAKSYGTTRDGALYYGGGPVNVSTGAYTAAFDPETLEVIESPKLVAPSFAEPAWSADGRYLAYLSQHEPDLLLVTRSLQSGRETVTTLDMVLRGVDMRGRWLAWHPDGGSLFVQGTYRDRVGLFQVDITDGATPQFVHDTWHGIVGLDGTTMYRGGYVCVEREDEDTCLARAATIMAIDLETGLESEFYRSMPGHRYATREGLQPARVVTQTALSPDGREIVMLAGTTEAPVLTIISTTDGVARHLTDLKYRGEPIQTQGLAWTPDGDNIVFFGRTFPADQWSQAELAAYAECREAGDTDEYCEDVRLPVRLYRIPAAGGDLEPAGLESLEPVSIEIPAALRNLRSPQFRPDGREIRFTATRPRDNAVWVLENFLPKSEAGR
jgi:Tol biopolymer transport system component